MKQADEQPCTATGRVITNSCVAPGHFLLSLGLPADVPAPQPGQFVMIRDPGRAEPLLPRPFSVYGFRREEGQSILDLLYRVAGRGTSLISGMKPDALLAVLGPLGRGFTLHKGLSRVVLLAGGVGVAPLAFLLHEGYLRNSPPQKPEVIVYVGARRAELLTGLERLRGFCDLRTATDDGSSGHHGPVTDLLRNDLDGYDPGGTMIYACGPPAMIRALGMILEGSAIPCEVSLEERMACGIGACLGCAVAITEGHEKIVYRRVCHDGPVFDIRGIFRNPGGNDQE